MILESQMKSINAIYKSKPGRVAYIYNPSTDEVETWGFLQLKSSLLYMWATNRACLLF